MKENFGINRTTLKTFCSLKKSGKKNTLRRQVAEDIYDTHNQQSAQIRIHKLQISIRQD